MSKPLVIFGSAEIAELAKFYFTHDSERKVVAFTLDETYVKEQRSEAGLCCRSARRANATRPMLAICM